METSNDELLQQFMHLIWHARRQQMRSWFSRDGHTLGRFGPFAGSQQGQGRVLKLLTFKPEISQKELASILDIRPQSLGELLIKLEKAGYVTRTPSETDRRSMNVSLTDAGRAAAEQPDAPTPMDDIFDVLGEEERAQLSAILAKLIAQFEAMPGEDDENGPRGPGFGGHGGFGGFNRGRFGGFGRIR